MKKKREEIARQQMEQQEQQRRQIANMNPIEVANAYENKLAEQGQMINNIMQENNVLKIKIDYLEKKISELIKTAISNKKICNDVNSL
jgi:hypothetical protein